MDETKVTRYCERCGKEYKVYKSEVNRGKGVFCSRGCSKYFKYAGVETRICKWCGLMFRTMGNECCCKECQDAYVSAKE